MKEGLAELLFGYQGGDYGLQPVAMVINIFITPVYAHSNLSGIDPCDSHVVKKKKKNWVKNFVHFKPPRLIHQTYSCWPEKPIPVACGVNFTKPEINLSYASAEIPQQWNQMQLKNSKTINCVIILRWQTTKGGKRRWKIVKIFWGFRLWKIVS